MESINLKIAYKHLSSRIKQTLIALLSVTFGISMYIFMNGFMTGVNNTQTNLAFSTLAHVRVYNDLPEDKTLFLTKNLPEDYLLNIRNPKVIQYTDGIKNSREIIDLVSQYPEVDGVTSQLNINVFYRNGATSVNGSLSGVDVDNEERLFKIEQYITAGDWQNLDRRQDGIILGQGLARKLSVQLNDNIKVITSDNTSRNYTVVGIFQTTSGSVDNGKAYITINAARQLLAKNRDYASDIQINIKDYAKAQQIADRLQRAVPYEVDSWQEANGQLDAANGLRDIVAIAVSLTILLVAGFGIYNIMNMTVNEKIKDIAILKAMGFEGHDIVSIFLAQSIIIGFMGGVLGLLLGYAISSIIHAIPFKIANLETLPVAFVFQDYLMAFLFGLITTFIAGYLPAKKAAKVDPIEIIRG